MIDRLLSKIDRSAHTSQGSKPDRGKVCRRLPLAPPETWLVGVRVFAKIVKPTTRFLDQEYSLCWAKSNAPELH